ncbi:MAG: thioesterase [Spirochaetia bacterium]|jgi:acyl-ACP thioesterase|nr:thioesterase [Spirochaetia bacterium]
MQPMDLDGLREIDADNVFREDFRSYTYNEDSHMVAKLSWFFELAQEMAAFHAVQRHCSIPELHEIGCTWVITHTEMQIDRYPHWPEVVHMETWAQNPSGIFIPRSVRAYDKYGKRCFLAKTFWAILDTNTGRPRVPSKIMEKLIQPTDSERYPQHCALPPRISRIIPKDIQEISHTQPDVTYGVTDSNHHVNNVAYINWLLTAMPNDFRDLYKVSQITVSWLRQTFLADHIHVQTFSDADNPFSGPAPIFFHQIWKDEQDGSKSKVFEAKTTWKPRIEVE